MMADKIDDVVKQTYRYFYEDGLVEMAVGLLFMATGAVVFAWQYIGESPLVTVLLILGIPVLALGGAFLLRRGVREAKERVTYRRTGYVAYREGEPSASRWLLLAAVLLLVVAGVIWPKLLENMSTAVGGLLAVVLLFLGYRVGLWRFYIGAAIAAVTGIGLALASVEEIRAVGLTFLASGLFFVLSGGLVLALYLYRYPQPEEEGYDG